MTGSGNRSVTWTRVLAVLMALMTLAMMICQVDVSAKSHSQKYWMKKTLKQYKAGNFSKAKKYNKKMNKYAKEKCVKKMSAKQKKKYRELVNKWPLEQESYDDAYLWDYFLTDYNNDGRADLILETGTCEADVVYRVYTYKKGKIKKLGKFAGGHSVLSAYPGTKGVVLLVGHMGYESICHVYKKGGKTAVKNINSRQTDNYIVLRNMLKSHVYYGDDYDRHIKLGDLK